MSIQWQGVFPAVTTKLNPDFSLDLNALRQGLERLIANGVGGVVMMGMVGENAQLSPEEKLTVLRTAVETCLLYTSPSPRDLSTSRMPSSA